MRATSRAPGYDHAGECSVNICANNNEMIQYTNLYSDGCNHKELTGPSQTRLRITE